MVRLKVYYFKQEQQYYFRFNSSMVRLKEADELNSQFKAMFQFQYGSIKSSFQLLIIGQEACFNSSMVRLKEKGTETMLGFGIAFQFQYGSIKRSSAFSRTDFASGFNSSMVRLKVEIKGQNYTAINEFQFQYGSIKRAAFRRHPATLHLFQFQYGSIKSPDRTVPAISIGVSIPVWFD